MPADEHGVILGLADAFAAGDFGGKAVQLGAAIRNGLPVPAGFALSPPLVDALLHGDETAIGQLGRACDELGPVAVRSSALDEDSAGASFAGAHLSVLGISGLDATLAAVRAVHESGQDPGARSYRTALGLADATPMAIVIQELVDADMAGVLFTRNPVTGADERVIEATWGLGEAVVSGLVTPDHYRLARGGTVLERGLGDKDVAIRPCISPGGAGGTEEVPISAAMSAAFCLGDAELADLDALATRCDRVYESTDHDIEFAFGDGAIFLLQRRPITSG